MLQHVQAGMQLREYWPFFNCFQGLRAGDELKASDRGQTVFTVLPLLRSSLPNIRHPDSASTKEGLLRNTAFIFTTH